MPFTNKKGSYVGLEMMHMGGFWFRKWNLQDVTHLFLVTQVHVLAACASFVPSWEAFLFVVFLGYLTATGVTLGWRIKKWRMLRWTSDKTMVDMIPNGVFRVELGVDFIIDKMREGRLRWFGHVKRRPQSAPVRRVEAMVVKGSRRRGRPKLRWEDRIKLDMKELLLSVDMTSDRNE
ncbi:hypothetical protein Tco_0612353 [Tanacetum coccineum]